MWHYFLLSKNLSCPFSFFFFLPSWHPFRRSGEASSNVVRNPRQNGLVEAMKDSIRPSILSRLTLRPLFPSLNVKSEEGWVKRRESTSNTNRRPRLIPLHLQREVDPSVHSRLSIDIGWIPLPLRHRRWEVSIHPSSLSRLMLKRVCIQGQSMTASDPSLDTLFAKGGRSVRPFKTLATNTGEESTNDAFGQRVIPLSIR